MGIAVNSSIGNRYTKSVSWKHWSTFLSAKVWSGYTFKAADAEIEKLQQQFD